MANFLQPAFCMLPRSVFVLYVRIFIDRLYPVFPVIDKDSLLALLELDEYKEQQILADLYAFLTALSATIIVQLNVDVGVCPLESQTATFNNTDNNT